MFVGHILRYNIKCICLRFYYSLYDIIFDSMKLLLPEVPIRVEETSLKTLLRL